MPRYDLCDLFWPWRYWPRSIKIGHNVVHCTLYRTPGARCPNFLGKGKNFVSLAFAHTLAFVSYKGKRYWTKHRAQPARPSLEGSYSYQILTKIMSSRQLELVQTPCYLAALRCYSTQRKKDMLIPLSRLNVLTSLYFYHVISVSRSKWSLPGILQELKDGQAKCSHCHRRFRVVAPEFEISASEHKNLNQN